MAILIEGMEMPKTCELCPLVDRTVAFHFLSFKCKVTKKFRPDSCFTRPDSCPLIEVPEPHGRLIDAEKLKSYWAPDHSRYFDADYFIHTIDVAQTIIPASESEERPVFLPQYELTPRSEEG